MQVGGGGGHLQRPDASRLLEKVGAMKQACRNPPELRLHPPCGLKTGLGLPASDRGSEEGRWLAQLQGVSAGSLSHLGQHGWLPPCSTCTGQQGYGCEASRRLALSWTSPAPFWALLRSGSISGLQALLLAEKP